MVATREFGDALHIAVHFLAHQRQGTPADLQLPAMSGSQYRDDVIRHLGDFGHQTEHRGTGHLDHPGIADGAHGHRPGATAQEADPAHELRRAERERHEALLGERIDHFDLAAHDIREAIHRIAMSCEEHSRAVVHFCAGSSQGPDVRFCQRRTLHFSQIAADAFHCKLPMVWFSASRRATSRGA